MSNLIMIIILYLIVSVIYNHTYKILTINMKSAGTLTVLIHLFAGGFSLLLMPLFKFKLPNNMYVYLFLFVACIFYALYDRISTTVRNGLEASVFSIIKQLSNVGMIFIGLIIFKENFELNKVIGSFFIILSNVLVFYKKRMLKKNKYFYLGLLSMVFLTIALLIDVSYSNKFNLAFYVAFILIVPSIIIIFFERIKIKEIIVEYKFCTKKMIYITSLCSSLMMISKIYAYQLGDVILVAPLCSLNVICNIIIGYVFFKEKSNLLRKLISSILIIIGIILIK